MAKIELATSQELIVLVGPSAVGKSAIIGYLCKDYGLHKPTSFTTRQQRSTETGHEYHFLSHADLPMMEERIVQSVTHPDGNVYGTTIEEYPPNALCIIDAMTSSVQDFKDAGFRLDVFGVIASPDEWIRRLNDRFPTGDPDRLPRLKEAHTCLTWIHDNRDDVTIILNDASSNEPAAAEIIQKRQNNPQYRTNGDITISKLLNLITLIDHELKGY
ncbi:MAG: hypothetical protein Q4A34_03325 [Candidatus Saccharibacteria bacterium]|nr:hypothetical protein [Candidatus Saccharibacteria bacterium]